MLFWFGGDVYVDFVVWLGGFGVLEGVVIGVVVGFVGVVLFYLVGFYLLFVWIGVLFVGGYVGVLCGVFGWMCGDVLEGYGVFK